MESISSLSSPAFDAPNAEANGPATLASLLTGAELEFWEGYVDGRDKDCPEPSENRSHAYRHSFAVGRAELANKPIPASLSRERAAVAEAKDAGA